MGEKQCLTGLLAYTTVRLECKLASGEISVGTGFFAEFKQKVIVTNKHVVRKSVGLKVTLSVKEIQTGYQKKWTVNLAVSEGDWIKHPDADVDLCFLPIPGLIALAGKVGFAPIIVAIPEFGIEGIDKMVEYGQMDTVTMIGYPDALYDQQNNQPIFRRGIMATNPNLDFNGKKEFLIDMPVYNGSSGSPVLVVREGTFVSRRTGEVCVANSPNCHLVGVVYATYQHFADGSLKVIPVPTTSRVVPVVSVPNNIGLVIKAERVLELKRMFDSLIM